MDCSYFPVTREQAKATLEGLGENWWRQLIDGKVQKHGSMVFDLGLHHGDKEPGYLESLLKAHEFTKEHVCEPLTKKFYNDLHKTACAHFKGKENCTVMSAEFTGQFRKSGTRVYSEYSLETVLKLYSTKGIPPMTEQEWKDYSTMEAGDFHMFKPSEKELRALRVNTLINQLLFELKENNLSKLNEEEYIDEPRFMTDAKRIRSYTLAPDGKQFVLKITFPCNDFDSLVENLFKDFNEKMAKIYQQPEQQSDKVSLQKLRCIADLHQKLEWMHPFQDGQGRTDLLLLEKLLAEHGFTPAILNEPFVSTFLPLDNWVTYLQEGMNTWAAYKEASDKEKSESSVSQQ